MMNENQFVIDFGQLSLNKQERIELEAELERTATSWLASRKPALQVGSSPFSKIPDQLKVDLEGLFDRTPWYGLIIRDLSIQPTVIREIRLNDFLKDRGGFESGGL